MRVGYARVSTADQSLDLQLAALGKCDRVIPERESGAKSERPQLNQCLKFLRAGDVLVVWKLDRLGRSLRELVAMLQTSSLRANAQATLTLTPPS